MNEKLHGLAEVLDGGDLLEDLLEPAAGGHIGATGGLGLGEAGLPGVGADEPVEASACSASRSGTVSVSLTLANDSREAVRPFLGELFERAVRAAAKDLTSVGPSKRPQVLSGDDR